MFFEFFSSERKIYIVWNWFTENIIRILQEYLFLVFLMFFFFP